MKTKNILKIVCFVSVFSTLQFTSCSESEYLDRVSPTELSDADIFSTPARIEGLVNGIYAALKDANFYGGRLLMFLDAGGEDFINTTVNSFTGFEAWAHTVNSGSADVINVWSAGYTTINNANIVIDGLSDPENAAVVGDQLAAQYIAEAKFLRALSYYTMITLFARPYIDDNGASPGLPLRLQAETSTENNDLARSTVAEVYQQIIQDLDEAESDLPDNYANALLNTTRAHSSTAIALKTRVYLSQANWPRVIAEAQKIVPQASAPFSTTFGVQHALQADPVSAIMIDMTTTESILSMPFTNLDYYSGQNAIGYMYDQNAEYYLNPAGIFGDSQWAETDARRGFLRLNANNGRSFLTKFGNQSPYLIYIPVIRYSEVLLNYAEAAAETGDVTMAASLLNAVHARSDESYTFSNEVLSNSTGLVDAILKERRIELLGEGFRSNDIRRRLQTFPAKSGPTPAQAVAPSASNYIWPISNNELVTNALIN
ncbi:RagB/SusD family nutrient uptake outer membrane protein [Olivibacter sp. XZL3]|uniref:RagB/SusD family nutrient uptake outer membrane protein n=1 Tax=Olivibacter sp. XZL3 TaxID=1735116 RepID=UPI0010655381|nr:RagB/SusD family nutrient uptake outer membrane protein [Olivibacter sp. XZL3]